MIKYPATSSNERRFFSFVLEIPGKKNHVYLNL